VNTLADEIMPLASQGYACQSPRIKQLTGLYPHRDQELKLFTVAEVKNQRYCYLYKGKFDRDKFLTYLGLSI